MTAASALDSCFLKLEKVTIRNELGVDGEVRVEGLCVCLIHDPSRSEPLKKHSQRKKDSSMGVLSGRVY